MKRNYLFVPVALCGAICASPAAAQTYANLATSLFAENVIGGGDDGAAGDFNGEIDFRRGRLCYYLELDGLDDASAIAIHKGDAGAVGPEVLALTLPGANGDEVCVSAQEPLLRSLSESAAEHYMIVRSESHPDGAVRGQLHD